MTDRTSGLQDRQIVGQVGRIVTRIHNTSRGSVVVSLSVTEWRGGFVPLQHLHDFDMVKGCCSGARTSHWLNESYRA